MFNVETYEKLGAFFLGRTGENAESPLLYDARDLTTHAVCVGMTGSGKTGLCIGLLEEALIDGIPAIVIDPKGDIGNLLLNFPDLDPASFEPWIDPADAQRKGITVPELAAREAQKWKDGLASWGQGPDRIQKLRDAGEISIYTPGSSAGRSVSILGSLAAPSAATRDDAEAFADRVSGTATSLLALLGIDADPLQSSEHVFLSTLLTHFWSRGRDLDLATLIKSIQAPPFDTIGVMSVDDVFGKKDRADLAMRTNNLLAAPAFAPWLQGEDLDIDAFMRTPEGKPRISIFSIAHLDESERMFFVSLLLGRVLDWIRQQSGTSSLRALLYMDEIFGYLPPVANPPSKKPLLTMLKQARAFGVGLVLATQNPVDVDYKALSNAGTWFLGRLQTEQDIERVIDGLLSADDTAGLDRTTLKRTLAGLKSREFLLQNVHEDRPIVFNTRWVLSYLRGPLTREDIRRLTSERDTAAAPPRPLEPPTESAPQTTSPAPSGASGTRGGDYLSIRVPGGDGDELIWRPMAYAEGSAHCTDGRRDVDETVPFALIRGLQDGEMDFDWADSAAVDLDHTAFGGASQDGRHLDVPAEAESSTTWDAWRSTLVDHVTAHVGSGSHKCPKLRMSSEPGETEAHFRSRVELAVREKRDAAVEKLRERYTKKVERLDDRLERARHALQTQEDQARDAKLSAAMNVGEALLGMFGGRKRRVSTSRATRIMKEGRDVDRAEDKVQDVLEDLQSIQAEMETALAEEADEFQLDDYPIETALVHPNQDEVDVRYCGLVWVPYWMSADGSRRRGH